MSRLPPLKALRVFEAAARHLSFTRAADELCVTQGAVSQQIKVLEESLGIQLFVRLNQELRLTNQGRTYALEIREALRLISTATSDLLADTEKSNVTISCLPSFAHKWLSPRLGKFSLAHPEISLRVHTSFEVVDLAREGVDCAIRHGAGGYEDCFAEILLTEELTPMCSSAIASKIKKPGDLVHYSLINDFGTLWEDWLVEAEIDPSDMTWGPEFQDSSLAMQAATVGQGIILGHTALAHDDLTSGALVAPFDLRVPYDCAHWFVCPSGSETNLEIQAVHAWLKQEAEPFPKPAIRLGRLPSPPAQAFG